MRRSLGSLHTRFLLLTAGIVLAAIAATALLVSQASRSALSDQAERSVAANASVFDALSAYAATHPSWDGVEPLVRQLALESDQRIALVDRGGRTLVDSSRLLGRSPAPLPGRPAAEIDPLGPVRAISVVGLSGAASPVPSPPALSGAPAPAPGPVSGAGSVTAGPAGAVVTSNRAAAATTTCLEGAGVPIVSTRDASGVVTVLPAEADPQAGSAYARCSAAGLRASVAPPVRLFLGDGAGLLDLVGVGWARLLLLVLAVVAAVLPVAFLVGRRITRPLERVTAAARDLEGGDLSARVAHAGGDEVATLAHAFNSLAGSLEQNEEARRRMVSDIAHELRNPLVTIHGTLEAVEDGVFAPGPEVISSLLDETAHLRRLVDDLADLALADAGALRLETGPHDLAGVARATAEAQSGVARAAGVSLEVEAAEPVAAEIDPDRTRQIVANLLANAIRHTPRGGRVTIAVSARGERAELVVADTGEGIPAGDLPHVFGRFYRADPARGRDTGGTGLGLAIARELCVAQGGEIGVDSEPGRGSRFTLSLPAAAAVAV